jgi:hypothetical protein
VKRSGDSEPSDHQTSHRDINQRFATLSKRFKVFGQPSTVGEPGKGPFHHPAPRQDSKAFLPLRVQHWLQANVILQQDPLQQLPAIGAIHPDAAQFLAGAS